MLNALKAFFDQYINPDAQQLDEERRLKLACAALLTEVARMDEELSAAERERVIGSIQAKFSLSHSEAGELAPHGQQEARDATDYNKLTTLINRSFSVQQKVKLVEHLWQVAYVDGQLNRYEEHLVRKIADLLYVPHAEFIAAKQRARNRA
jgi:uncharacterized tellurite resistance protein B-like protein